MSTTISASQAKANKLAQYKTLAAVNTSQNKTKQAAKKAKITKK